MSAREEEASRRIELLCAAGLDAKALREGVLAEVRPVVGFDAHVWGLCDPVTRVITSPHADVPFLPWSALPHVIRCRYLTTLNRWDSLATGDSPVGLLHQTTGGELARSYMWREAWADYDVVDIATVVFADRFGCWGTLDLLRRAPAEPFAAGHKGFLARMVDAVTRGLRDAQARTFSLAGERVGVEGPAVAVLDSQLQVQVQTSAAASALMRLLPPGADMAPIPAAVYNVAASLIASEHDVPVGPPRSRVHLANGQWVTLRADRIAADIAVTIEPSTPADRQEVFGLALGMSPRERDVLAGLMIGDDNRTISRRLNISDHTAHDHVKAVLAKAGVPSRQVLLSRVAGSG